MSVMSNLAYEIEELYIEGYSPKAISALLSCPIEMVYDWLDAENLSKEYEHEQA